MSNFIIHKKTSQTGLPYTYTFLNNQLIDWFQITYTPSATVGTRQMIVTIYDEGGNQLLSLVPRVTQTAADGTITYQFIYGANNETVTNDKYISINLPKLFVEPNWKITIIDQNSIDLAADAVSLTFQGESN